MSNPTNHWKLGLFVVVGFCVAVATVTYLGAQSLHKVTVTYNTYFDESVQGLEVGSPVKFRGVTIGTVSGIDLGEDHRHVEVSCDLGVKVLNRLGLSDPEGQGGRNTKISVPPDLRAQLVATGITGVKFIQIDFFNPKDYPPPNVPFEVPENYIPAAPSVMKNLEDSVVHAVDRFPVLADQLLVVTARLGDILQQVEAKQLPDKASTALVHLDQVLTDVHVAVTGLEAGKLSRDAQDTLKSVNAAATRAASDRGFLASAQRTSDAVGNMAVNANHVGPALEETLRDVQSAAVSIQRLADSLDIDPDMLIKGRAKRVTK